MKKYEGMFKKYFEMRSRKLSPEEEAKRLFESVSTMDAAFLVGENNAFVVYCDELLQKLRTIRNLNALIDACDNSLPPKVNEQFVRQALVEEIQQTNEIENVESTRKEIRDALRVVEKGRSGKRFEGMVRKYRMLLDREIEIELASCADVRALYDSFILREVLRENEKDAPDGVFFRKEQVSVIKNGQEVHGGVWPESKLNKAMEQALAFLNNEDYDPLIRIAAFHYMFGYIHPFYNGNGRMARFISSYMLTREGINLLVALRLSYTIKSNRAKYYKMFETTNDKRNFGDMTMFVISFLDFVEQACQEVAEFLKEKIIVLDAYKQKIDAITKDETVKTLLYILVQVSVCEGESLTVSELAEMTDVSEYIVRKNLEKVGQWCVLRQRGKAKLYRADLDKLDEI